MIEGVKIKALQPLPDERAKVVHLLRADDPDFERFGEIYFSLVHPGVIKGWHLHQEMTLHYAVVKGMIKLVLYDERSDVGSHGDSMELFVGDANYVRVTVPPGVWNGFKGIGAEPAIVVNCATIPYHPAEIVRMDPLHHHVPYDWSLKHR